MTITLGSVLQRIEQAENPAERFCVLMPTASGPCRFGVYNLLYKITFERLGLGERVHVWSPKDSDYFEGLAPGFSALVLAGFMAYDLLGEAFYDARPGEREPGAAERIFRQATVELSALLERAAAEKPSVRRALTEVATGRLFGCAELLRRAARQMAAVKSFAPLPTVLVVGEIYVRCDRFANDFVIDKLEAAGIRVRFAPFNEWLEYTDHLARLDGAGRRLGSWLSSRVQARIQQMSYDLVGDVMGWPRRTTVGDSLQAAAPYLRDDLRGEAVLTLGGPLHEWHEGLIDGVVNAGPLECMPSKIAEAQFFHAAEREGLLSLTLSVNGDPVDPEVIDGFVYEVKSRFKQRHGGRSMAAREPARPRQADEAAPPSHPGARPSSPGLDDEVPSAEVPTTEWSPGPVPVAPAPPARDSSAQAATDAAP